MHRAVPLAVLLPVLCSAATLASAATTFHVTVPGHTPGCVPVHLAGDFQGWNPGSPSHALTRLPDGRWSISLSLAPGQPIQFKFTRGSWATVEKGPSGEEIANRVLTPQDGATYDFTVASWADGPGTVTGSVEWFSDPSFLGGRCCWVYLPPDYATGTDRYPVLYMHDGQNLFDVRTSFAGEWRVDEACESLIAGGEVQPIIVVGVANGGASRVHEYTPWYDPGFGAGGGADAYLAAVRDVLIPIVNARYRTRTGPAHTFLAGSSLGGLVSAYAGYAYDATFGRVAAVSPSYWWSNRAMLGYAQSQPKPDLARFYQDMGTAEGASHVDNVNTMHAIAVGQGFQSGVDLLTVLASGQGHNEAAWASRFPDLLRFLIDGPLVGVPGGRGLREAPFMLDPNPVRAAGRFRFTLPAAGVASIDLFDVTGRHVQRIVEGRFDAGSNVVQWDARDRPGAGIYWARLRARGVSAVRRVVALD